MLNTPSFIFLAHTSLSSRPLHLTAHLTAPQPHGLLRINIPKAELLFPLASPFPMSVNKIDPDCWKSPAKSPAVLAYFSKCLCLYSRENTVWEQTVLTRNMASFPRLKCPYHREDEYHGFQD